MSDKGYCEQIEIKQGIILGPISQEDALKIRMDKSYYVKILDNAALRLFAFPGESMNPGRDNDLEKKQEVLI